MQMEAANGSPSNPGSAVTSRSWNYIWS